MTPSFATRLLAALCILAFGLSQAVSYLGVRCRDSASGETRFELVCVKSTQGGCVTANEHCSTNPEAGDAQNSSCQDEPMGQQAVVANLLRTSGDIAIASAAPHEPPYGWSTVAGTPAHTIGAAIDRADMPHALRCLRTIILRV